MKTYRRNLILKFLARSFICTWFRFSNRASPSLSGCIVFSSSIFVHETPCSSIKRINRRSSASVQPLVLRLGTGGGIAWRFSACGEGVCVRTGEPAASCDLDRCRTWASSPAPSWPLSTLARLLCRACSGFSARRRSVATSRLSVSYSSSLSETVSVSRLRLGGRPRGLRSTLLGPDVWLTGETHTAFSWRSINAGRELLEASGVARDREFAMFQTSLLEGSERLFSILGGANVDPVSLRGLGTDRFIGGLWDLSG